MRKLINFIKADFDVVSDALCSIRGKKIPKVFLVLYYVIVLIIVSPTIPFFMIWKKHKINKLFKEWEENCKEEA